MTYPTLTYFGMRIKAARSQQAMQPEELARKVGLSVTEIHRIERGMRDVSIVEAQMLAQALDVGLAYLI
jgi:transcriptional regulator with XRE-family HTH domain